MEEDTCEADNLLPSSDALRLPCIAVLLLAFVLVACLDAAFVGFFAFAYFLPSCLHENQNRIDEYVSETMKDGMMNATE
jgi:nitrate reductase NapE component